MTITVSTSPQLDSVASPPSGHSGRSRHGGGSSREATQIDVTMFAGLLDDPAIALWAAEASAKYQVSALGAIGLLAHALLVDGER
jgi:hypothetical protein